MGGPSVPASASIRPSVRLRSLRRYHFEPSPHFFPLCMSARARPPAPVFRCLSFSPRPSLSLSLSLSLSRLGIEDAAAISHMEKKEQKKEERHVAVDVPCHAMPCHPISHPLRRSLRERNPMSFSAASSIEARHELRNASMGVNRRRSCKETNSNSRSTSSVNDAITMSPTRHKGRKRFGGYRRGMKGQAGAARAGNWRGGQGNRSKISHIQRASEQAGRRRRRKC